LPLLPGRFWLPALIPFPGHEPFSLGNGGVGWGATAEPIQVRNQLVRIFFLNESHHWFRNPDRISRNAAAFNRCIAGFIVPVFTAILLVALVVFWVIFRSIRRVIEA